MDAVNGYHVLPVDDLVEHDGGTFDCVCGPDVLWRDPDTGEFFKQGQVVVVHHPLDGREHNERLDHLLPGDKT